MKERGGEARRGSTTDKVNCPIKKLRFLKRNTLKEPKIDRSTILTQVD